MTSSYTEFQGDGAISNGSGFAVRTEINAELKALYSTSIGPTEPTTKHHCQLWADNAADQLKIRDKNNNGWIVLRGLDASFQTPDGSQTAPSYNFASSTNTGIFKEDSQVDSQTTRPSLSFSTAGVKRLTIGGGVAQSVGGESLLWNVTDNPVTTGTANSNVNGVQFTSVGRVNIGNFGACIALNRHSSDGHIVEFHKDTVAKGDINITSSGVSYNTGSDYRLKENVVNLTNAKSRVNQLKVNRFNFIADPERTVDGFMAHEVATIVPEAITGLKDEVDEAGKPVYQSIDQAKLVPLLTAALQEAFAEIAALTTRIETLEAG